MKTMMTSIAMMTLTFTMSTMVFAQPEGKGNRAKTEAQSNNAKARKPPQTNRKDFDRGYISPLAVRSYTGATTVNAGTLSTSAKENGNGRGANSSAKTGPGTVQAGLEGDPNRPVVMGAVDNTVQEHFVSSANGGVWKTNDVRENPANPIAVDPSDPTGSTVVHSDENIIGVLIAK